MGTCFNPCASYLTVYKYKTRRWYLWFPIIPIPPPERPQGCRSLHLWCPRSYPCMFFFYKKKQFLFPISYSVLFAGFFTSGRSEEWAACPRSKRPLRRSLASPPSRCGCLIIWVQAMMMFETPNPAGSQPWRGCCYGCGYPGWCAPRWCQGMGGGGLQNTIIYTIYT